MKKLMMLLVLALAATALVACGDDDGTTTTDTGGETAGGAAEGEGEAGAGGKGGLTVKFEADPEGGLAYTSDEEFAEAGNVTIDLINPQSLAHDVAIEDSNGEQVGKTEVITESEDSTTVQLEPGEYTFYCTVPGHREAGMEGTLTVE
jgi:plastocyanin